MATDSDCCESTGSPNSKKLAVDVASILVDFERACVSTTMGSRSSRDSPYSCPSKINQRSIQNLLSRVVVLLQHHLERVLAVQHDHQDLISLVVIALFGIEHVERHLKSNGVAVHVRAEYSA